MTLVHEYDRDAIVAKQPHHCLVAAIGASEWKSTASSCND